MAYTTPAGNEVALALGGAYTAPAGNAIAIAFADPIPPDPDPDVPVRWTGTAATWPWQRAERRARQVQSRYARSAERHRVVGLPWSEAARRGAARALPWSKADTHQAARGMPWRAAPKLATPSIGVPWSSLPRFIGAGAMPWSAPDRASSSAGLAWNAPPRIDIAVSLPWGTPPRASCSAGILWRSPPDVVARWWLPWSYAQRIRWRVHSPGVDPPPSVDPPTYEPPAGNHAALNFACPQLTFPGHSVPVPFGPAACYFAWPRPRRYIVMNSAAVVRLPERTPISVSAVSLNSSVDDAFWSISMTLADTAALAYLLPDAGGLKVVEININGHVWTAAIESHQRNRRFPSQSVTVSGRSQACTLDAPYVAPRSLVSDADMQAQSLAEAELDLTGFTLDYDTLTWLVPAGVWRYEGATPIGAVRAIAAASGAILQSHLWDTQLRIVPRYPVSPWSWGVTAPDKQILDDMIYEDSLRVVSRPLYNYVLVSGEQVGVSDEIVREGSAGDVRLPMKVDPLIVEHDVALERGRNELCDRGEQAQIDLVIPLYPASATDKPGLVLPLHLVEVVELVAWKGLAIATSIEASMQSGGNGTSVLVVNQRITLERHYSDAG